MEIGRFNGRTCGQLEKTKEESNVIAVGTMNNNPVIKNANDDLYFQYNKTGDYFLSNEKSRLKKIMANNLVVCS